MMIQQGPGFFSTKPSHVGQRASCHILSLVLHSFISYKRSMLVLENIALLWNSVKALALIIFWTDPQSHYQKIKMSTPKLPSTPISADKTSAVPKLPGSVKKKVPASPD